MGNGALSKARQGDDVQAKKDLFEQLDANNDGSVTVVEFYDYIQTKNDAIKTYWTLDVIKATIERYDVNKDGKSERRAHCACNMPHRRRGSHA